MLVVFNDKYWILIGKGSTRNKYNESSVYNNDNNGIMSKIVQK